MKLNPHLQVEEGIGNWTLLAIVLSCASPAITLNVWPRIDSMLQNGFHSNSLGIVLLVTLSALGMTCVPFAMKKAENLGFWLTCLLFGIGLGILNYTMAVGAVGKSRDDEAGAKLLVIQKANSLKLAISEGEAARRSLPAFRWTTQEMVSTATKAVDLAREARDQECTKVGDHCRARVAQLGNRQSELSDLSSSRAFTERAEFLDKTIRTYREEISSLGAIPASDDQQASRIANVVGFLLPLGSNASEKVATGLIHFLAICAEAFALGMPRIIVTALSRKEKNAPPTSPVVKEDPLPEKPKAPISDEKPLAPRNPPPPRSRASNKPEAPILEWRTAYLIRSTGKIRDWEAFEHYKNWAKEKTLSPSSFLTFNQELERLGVKKETDPVSKRDFYLEVAIKTTLKAVS